MLYAFGVWHVKPGCERELIDAWRDLAGWTAAEFIALGARS